MYELKMQNWVMFMIQLKAKKLNLSIQFLDSKMYISAFWRANELQQFNIEYS
jgi:hypothetical protein